MSVTTPTGHSRVLETLLEPPSLCQLRNSTANCLNDSCPPGDAARRHYRGEKRVRPLVRGLPAHPPDFYLPPGVAPPHPRSRRRPTGTADSHYLVPARGTYAAPFRSRRCCWSARGMSDRRASCPAAISRERTRARVSRARGSSPEKKQTSGWASGQAVPKRTGPRTFTHSGGQAPNPCPSLPAAARAQ